jgi:hypothetical protein
LRVAQCDEARRNAFVDDEELAYRYGKIEPARAGTPRIDEEHLFAPFDHRAMRMTRDDDVYVVPARRIDVRAVVDDVDAGHPR